MLPDTSATCLIATPSKTECVGTIGGSAGTASPPTTRSSGACYAIGTHSLAQESESQIRFLTMHRPCYASSVDIPADPTLLIESRNSKRMALHAQPECQSDGLASHFHHMSTIPFGQIPEHVYPTTKQN